MALTDWRALHGEAFDGAAVVVTGGAGFIGSHVAEALVDLGAHVTVVDDLSGGEVANLEAFHSKWDGRLRFVEGSILDERLLGELASGARYVFHLAALGSVPRSVEQPVRYSEVNIAGTQTVLEAAKASGVRRVIFSASSSAYGDSEVLPKVETMAPSCKSPYAATKLADEALMSAYASSYADSGLDTASLRYFNIFGPRQNANSAYAAVIAAFAKAYLGGTRPMIFGDGEQSRDFTFVDNAVHANLLAARCENRLGGKVMNVACGMRISVNELAEQMGRMLGRPDLTPEYREERAGDVKHSLADLTRVKATLGYEPVVDFEPGLDATCRWYRQTMAPAGG